MTDPTSRNDMAGRAEATKLVRGGQRRTGFHETAEPIFATSGFVYGDAAEAEAAFVGDIDRFIYSRFSNPTVALFEERLRLVEGAEVCRATASGMAAVFGALASFLGAGDRLVVSRALFGSCAVVVNEILPRFGVDTVVVDGRDLGAWEQALAEPTRAVFIESPSNPGLELIDIAAVAELAHAAGATLVVDNVFATPILQRPLELGADVVVYSATKHLDGQGRTVGGAVLCSATFDDHHLREFLRHTGPSLSPFNAWVLAKGMETLRLRVDAQCRSAARIADFLEGRPTIERVLYPMAPSHPQHDLACRQLSAGGTVVTLLVEGGKAEAFRMLDRLQLFDISNNLGDAKSLATHPATTTHRRILPEHRAELGITDAMVRLSVGLEDVDDLLSDLEEALAP
ncbi:MAG: O-succinylhomoserine sulfhydrylase [Actinomycetota bacterium]